MPNQTPEIRRGADSVSPISKPRQPLGSRLAQSKFGRYLSSIANRTGHRKGLDALASSAAPREGELLRYGNSMALAQELVQNEELWTNMENGMALDIAEFVLPAGIPNRNAVAIGCGNFPEAVPWTILAGGRIHGMDIATDLNIQHFLNSDRNVMASRGIDSREITYAVGPDGDARRIEGYNIQGKRYGAAIIKHPNITNFDPQVYADINAVLIDRGLEVNGVTLLTSFVAEEREMYMDILQPYVDLGIITSGITTPEGEMLLEPAGLDRGADSRATRGSDYHVFGFRKVRDMTDAERREIHEKSMQ